ncbi:hypothetical protein QYF61_021781 [Mycteria americana]|uniref:Uncharacterized protein n=1 Tax=Mycteria americana TaxID=33587 RepID=A0AAN7N1A2_MYCAM|nr:hypothetical protein QYF61_021781 [Mycteria americana]
MFQKARIPAKQPQLPEPLLIRLVLQTLHQLRCPSLDTLQHLNVSLVVRGPKLNTVFEVRPHRCRVQGDHHFPTPAGHTVSDTSQDAIGFLGHLGTLLAHIQPAVGQHPQVLLCQAAFQPLFPKPVALHGVVVTQVQDLALGLVEPHTVGLGPSIQPVQHKNFNYTSYSEVGSERTGKTGWDEERAESEVWPGEALCRLRCELLERDSKPRLAWLFQLEDHSRLKLLVPKRESGIVSMCSGVTKRVNEEEGRRACCLKTLLRTAGNKVPGSDFARLTCVQSVSGRPCCSAKPAAFMLRQSWRARASHGARARDPGQAQALGSGGECPGGIGSTGATGGYVRTVTSSRGERCGRTTGWGLNHFPEQPLPMLDDPFSEVKFPNIQSKPPLAQLEAISSRRIACYLGEETDPHLATTSFQAKQPQFPQPLLIRLVLQTLHQLRCPSLDTLQHLNGSLVVRGPKLNTAFEVRPHQCRIQGDHHFPSPAGHTIPDTSQDAIGHLGTLLAHTQLAVNQHSQILFHQAAFQPLFPKPVALHGVVVTQVQDLALGFVEPHTIDLSPLIQPVQVPLQSLPTPKQINTPTQLGVICKLTEGALDPFIQTIDKDVKQNWPQHRALGNTACDRLPAGFNSIHHHCLGPAVQPVLYPAKSSPVQAMSSQFLQENAVGNSVKGFTEV